jgi:hypothetical protein
MNMNCLKTWSARKLIVGLTTVAVLMPAPVSFAADAKPAMRGKPVKLDARDVELQAQGTLQGYYVDGEQGAAKAGVKLTLHQNSAKPIATTTTGENGAFAFSGLRPGTYQIVADGEHVVAYRTWAQGTAPPKAARSVVFAAQDSTRAGLWFASLPPAAQLAILAAVAAGVAVPIAILANDDDHKQPNSPDGEEGD